MTKITVSPLHAEVVKVAGTGKCLVASKVLIMSGRERVAFATLGGAWTAADALKEFRKNPKRFTQGPGWFLHESGLAA